MTLKIAVVMVFLSFATMFLSTYIVSSLVAWIVLIISSLLFLFVTLHELRVGRFHREELRRSKIAKTPLAIIIVPVVSSALVFLSEFNFLQDWYKPIMISSLTIIFFTNMFSLPLALASKKFEDELLKETTFPPISVIIPAYNEEVWIRSCIEAVLEADYPSKEVIVVDDGSVDRTYEFASLYRTKGVIVLRKPNGGKASALNYGIRFSSADIIVSVDADTIISREALKHIVAPFKNHNVVGVAGNIHVVNKVNWLTKNQALEYITQLNIIRRATSYLGVVQVMPGPLAAYRKTHFYTVGGYDKFTLTEDFDVTVKLQKTGGIIQAPSQAKAYTEAPKALKSFYRQRIRWYRGNLQVLLRHRDALINPRYGHLTNIIFPLLVIQQIAVPVLGVAAIPAAVMIALAGGLPYVIMLFLVFTLLQSFISLIALDLDDEDVRMALYAPFAVIGYKQLLDIIAFKAIIDVLILRRRGMWTRAEKFGLEQLRA